MPVSSCTSRSAVSAAIRRLRGCRSPTARSPDARRARAAGRPCDGVWITTSTETGFLTAVTAPCRAARRCRRPASQPEHQKGMPCSRQSSAACWKDLQRGDEIAFGLAVDAVAVFEQDDVAVGRSPVHVAQAVDQRVEVVAEPVGEVRALRRWRRADCPCRRPWQDRRGTCAKPLASAAAMIGALSMCGT